MVNNIANFEELGYKNPSFLRVAEKFGGNTMLSLFESREKRVKDSREVTDLFRKYGEETVSILKLRARDKSLSQRDRRHWKRLFGKAKAYRPPSLDKTSSQTNSDYR